MAKEHSFRFLHQSSHALVSILPWLLIDLHFLFIQVLACANRDRAQVIEMSIRLGFLTGKESKVMLDAHTEAAFMVGLPFSRPGGFDFRTANLTQQVTQLGATMLQHRLTAPPDEAYSLHRKLSGAFLACVKMGSVVRCKEMFLAVYDNYNFTVKDKNLQAGTQ